jgi:hypothetical protein
MHRSRSPGRGLARAVLAGSLAASAVLPLWAAPGRALLVQVRDTPPASGASFRHGADGSYTVSTGGSGATDDARPDPGADNGTTLSTGNSSRALRVREGDRVRVDLPAVQSLQFHVPASAHAAPGGGAPGGSGATAPAARGPGATGVVSFEAVSAFAARFFLQGPRVRIELTPLRAGGVVAPMIGGADAPRALGVEGPVGAWIALGDPELGGPGPSLTPTAAPSTTSGVWVRVVPADAQSGTP